MLCSNILPEDILHATLLTTNEKPMVNPSTDTTNMQLGEPGVLLGLFTEINNSR